MKTSSNMPQSPFGHSFLFLVLLGFSLSLSACNQTPALFESGEDVADETLADSGDAEDPDLEAASEDGADADEDASEEASTDDEDTSDNTSNESEDDEGEASDAETENADDSEAGDGDGDGNGDEDSSAEDEDAAGDEDEASDDEAGADENAGDDEAAVEEPTAVPGTEEDPETGSETGADEPVGAGAPDSDYIGRSASGGSGGIFSLVDLRSGEHEGLTRFVWEFESSENLAPGDAPFFEVIEHSNAGQPDLGFEGLARIEVLFTDVYAYDFVGAMSLDTPESGVAKSMRTFPINDDAMLRFAIDIDEPSRFAVVALDDPPRLVLDVFED